MSNQNLSYDALLQKIEQLEKERDSWKTKYEELEYTRFSCCGEIEEELKDFQVATGFETAYEVKSFLGGNTLVQDSKMQSEVMYDLRVICAKNQRRVCSDAIKDRGCNCHKLVSATGLVTEEKTEDFF